VFKVSVVGAGMDRFRHVGMAGDMAVQAPPTTQRRTARGTEDGIPQLPAALHAV